MWRTLMMLAGIAGMAGCMSNEPEPVLSTDMGVRRYAGRSLAAFQAKLDKKLTPALAEKRFGNPDSVTGSGLLIYVYKLEDGRELLLGFPGFEPITYAKVKATDESITDLLLK
jgi:hypothetical protein